MKNELAKLKEELAEARQKIKALQEELTESNKGIATLTIEVDEELNQRKQAEEALRESENRLSGILNNMTDAVWAISWPDFTHDYLSPSLEKLYGRSKQEFMDNPTLFMEITHPDDQHLTEKAMKQLMEEGKAERECRIIKPDGNIVWVKDRSKMIYDENHQPIRVEGVTQDITERKQAEEEIQKSHKQLQKAMDDTIYAISKMVEIRDPYTAGHEEKVTKLSVAIGEKLGLPEDWIKGLYTAGIVHDIGKIYVPAEILAKPGRLTETEFTLIKAHSAAGYDILKNIEFPRPVADIVHQHHERIDGSGYPNGLKGDDILLEARIIAVADVVEAMSNHRPYRAALGIDVALGEIKKNSGKLYDTNVVNACIKIFEEDGFGFGS